jgi:RNA polymerase sigma factor (sigma-70 family)
VIFPGSGANNVHEMSTDQLRARFGDLLNENRRIVYKICKAYCPNRDDRDDLAQEIVTELWRSFASFDDRARFSTWLYRVALNVAISFNRREWRRTRLVVSGVDHLLEVTGKTHDEPEDLLLLHQFIEKLDPLNKALILLYLDGYAYREISGVLGITETNVATKISRLKNAMKTSFSTVGAA